MAAAAHAVCWPRSTWSHATSRLFLLRDNNILQGQKFFEKPERQLVEDHSLRPFDLIQPGPWNDAAAFYWSYVKQLLHILLAVPPEMGLVKQPVALITEIPLDKDPDQRRVIPDVRHA